MSPTAKRYPSPSSKDQEQAADTALHELENWLSRCNPDQRQGCDFLARWWEKWNMVAGPRKLGRILLALSRGYVKEVPHE